MSPARPSALRAAIHLGWALTLVGLLPAPGGAQEELLQELKTISRVEIEGRDRLSAGALRRVMKTRGPSLWPWREAPTLRVDYLRADVAALRELYRHHGFLDAEASYEVRPARGNAVEIRFRIREGERTRIREVRFEGVYALLEKDLRKRMWTRPGRPFDPAYIQLDTLVISALYQERGYRPYVEGYFERLPHDSLLTDVLYRVTEGAKFRIGELYVSGHDRVRGRLIQRELLLQPGSVYQSSRVVRTQERLYSTGLFSQVQIEPLPDSTRTVMNFDVRLRERRPRWIDAGIGSGTEERFRLVGEWGHRNVLGRGLQAVVGSRLTFYGDGKFQRWHAEASLLEPWLLRSRTRGQITPYYERHDDRAEPSWVVRQEFHGVNFQLRRELNRFTRVRLTQENLFARQNLVIVAPLPDSTRDSLRRAVVPRYKTHRVVLGLERDFRDNLFNPSRGSASFLSAEIAGGPLKGTSSFRKGQIVSSWYTPLPNGWVLATRAAAGLIDPYGARPAFSPSAIVDPEVSRVPLEDRFRIGGVNSLRGYNENSVPASGGLALLQGSVELRVPTPVRVPYLGPLGFEFYVDAGNVWARPEFIRWEHLTTAGSDTDPNAVRYVAGLGPRVDLPVGPLRVDVTWRWRPTRSHAIVQFAIGPSF